MKFSLKQIKEMIAVSLDHHWTTDPNLNAFQQSSVDLVGHTQPYYTLFWHIAKTLKPGLMVELGAWRGYGAAHFAAGNPEGKVVTIDIHKDGDQIAKDSCIYMARKYPNLTYINNWTWDAVADVAALNTPIDVLFIDAWHEYEYAMREFSLYRPLLADNALVICDDIFDDAAATKDMAKFWRELEGDKFLEAGVHPGIPMGFIKVVKAS
jgi:predicted O-methyltransferase YrrM